MKLLLKNKNNFFCQKSLWNSGVHYTCMRIILDKIQYSAKMSQTHHLCKWALKYFKTTMSMIGKTWGLIKKAGWEANTLKGGFSCAIKHWNLELQFTIAIWYYNLTMQFSIAIWHCNLALQLGIAIWHCNQCNSALQFDNAIQHCNLALQFSIAI